MKTIAFTTWRGITLASFGARPGSQEDWAAYLDVLRAAPQHRQRTLVTTQGGTLENYQRQELEQVIGPAQGRDRRVAVVTNSTFARGFSRALSRLDPSFKLFSQAELEAALDYVELPRSAWAECKQILAALAAQIAPG
jgi:hypothetical protein